jgi:hypothetical protein
VCGRKGVWAYRRKGVLACKWTGVDLVDGVELVDLVDLVGARLRPVALGSWRLRRACRGSTRRVG